MAYAFERFLPQTVSQFDAFAPPVEDPSLLSQIGGSALSGLGWLAEVLAKPDRILYALPSGNPQELLNILPFSDTFGWTDPSNMASASTALEYMGAIPKNTPGFDWWDPVRLGADILGSPSTYASFGASALTKGGEVARAAGVLDDLSRVERMTGNLSKLAKGDDAIADIATAALRSGAPLGELYNQPLQGLARFGIPFTNFGTTVGFGPTSQAIAGTLDTAGQLIGKTPVIGPTLDATRRFGRMLFDPSAKNRFAPREQELAGLAYRDRDAIKVAARGEEIDRITQSAPIRQAFHEAFGEDIMEGFGVHGPGNDVAGFSPGSVVYASDQGNYGHVLSLWGDTAKVYFRNPETGLEATKDLPVEWLTKVTGETAKEYSTKIVDDVYDRLVRMTADVGGDVPTAWEQLMPDARMDDNLARQIRDLVLDMQGANRRDWTELGDMGLPAPVMKEMELAGHFPRHVDQKLRQEFSSLRAQRLAGVRHPSAAARADELRYVPTEVINQMLVDPAARGANAADHILSEYGRWLRGYEEGPAKHAQALAEWIAGHKNESLFTRKWITDQVGYKQRVELAKANGRAIHEMISRTMGEAGDVAVDNAFKRAGMDANAALTFLSKKTGKTPSQLAGLKVPADVADAVAAYIKPHKSAEWLEMTQAVMGRFNQWFRRNVTLPFASFASRNFISGQHVNAFASGLMRTGRDVADYERAFMDVAKLIKNPEADAETVRRLYKYGVLNPRVGFEGVELSSGAGSLAPKSAFDVRSTWAQAGLDVAAQPSIVPGLDKLPGGKTLRRIGKTWMGTGERLNQNVEALNRAPMFLYLERKGWSPLAAAKKVNELQFDYSDFTAFEQGLRNTAIPFYAFQRKVAPLMYRNLIERPGGGVAQTIRATNYARGDRAQAATTPDYVSQTTSIPLGTLADGSQRFLTGLGLAHEVPAQYLGGGLREAGLEGLSQLSPLLKAPLEWFTKQSFFQRGPGGAGRPLETMDPTIRRTISNIQEQLGGEPAGRLPPPGLLEFAAANSPFSRYLTTARQLSDPRKGILGNVMMQATGLRFTDISPAAQEATLRQRAAELMKEMGARTFEKVYFDKDEIPNLPPEDQETATKLNALQRLLARKASARARLAEAGR